ncbi:hypothetical protein BN12_150034 [Nostocoides japonicum T1-X7]|uniref:Uncharacterized protein n=1 Tax=Nostocoides japonicum T1-X7 TaxID=1194083 RepID=A0A077LY44_9MICO|nr:hypothetical protein BN12_150034 [Tetrasphaera japonica T1-X7]
MGRPWNRTPRRPSRSLVAGDPWASVSAIVCARQGDLALCLPSVFGPAPGQVAQLVRASD